MKNREIKFKAWDYTNKKIYPVEMIDWDSRGGHVGLFIPKEGNEPWTTMRVPKGNVALMQYTGLKDKSGVDIFEGDIVRENRGSADIIFTVEPTEYLGFYFKNKVYGHDVDNGNRLEVIGNIYENPEFLDKGRD